MNRKTLIILLTMMGLIGIIAMIVISLKIHKGEEVDLLPYGNISCNIAKTVWEQVKDEPITEVTIKFDNGDEITFNSMNSLIYSSKANQDLNRLKSLLFIVILLEVLVIISFPYIIKKKNVFKK